MSLGYFQAEVYSLKCIKQAANNSKRRRVTTFIGISQKNEYKLHMVDQPVHNSILRSEVVSDIEQAKKPI